MIAAITGYVLRGGKPGYDRLLLLARDRRADTRALLERAGICAAMRCIDIGCGGGEVTMAIAAMVAPGGTVTGMDTDQVKLALARQAAAERGLGNVEFTALDVRDWDGTAGYDAVYARFLLHHLSQPEALLRRMWAALAGGGVLVVEDADFDRWCCDPPNAGFEFFLDAYRRVLARRGGDHATGRKLYRWFLAAGIPHPQITLVQPVHQEARPRCWPGPPWTPPPMPSSPTASRPGTR